MSRARKSPTSGDLTQLGQGVPPAVLDATVNQAAMTASPPVNPELIRAGEVAGAGRIGKNTLEILLFRVLTTVFSLAIVVVQSRFLAPSGRGVFVLAVLSVTVFSRLLGQLGVAITHHMSLPQYDTPQELRPLVQRALGIGGALGAAGGLLIVVWGSLSSSVGAGTAAIAAVALVPNVAWQTMSGVLLGLSRIRLWNYIQLLAPLLAVAGLSVVVAGLGGGVQAALGVWAASHVATAGIALAGTRDLWSPLHLPDPADRLGRAVLRLALTMGGVQVIALIGYRIELAILSWLKDVSAVGIYSIAQQAAESIWLVSAAVATAVTALVVRGGEDEAVRVIRGALLKSLLYTIAVSGLVVGLAPFVIPFALGDAFSSSVDALFLLIPGVIVYAPMQVLVVYLSVRRGQPHLSMIASVVAMAVTAVSAVPLIREFGASGAAVASTIGYLVGVSLALVFFLRLSGRPAPAS